MLHFLRHGETHQANALRTLQEDRGRALVGTGMTKNLPKEVVGNGTVVVSRLQSPSTSSIIPLDLTYRMQIRTKIIKNFKMATAERPKRRQASLLSVGPVQTYWRQGLEAGSLYIFTCFDSGVRAGGEDG